MAEPPPRVVRDLGLAIGEPESRLRELAAEALGVALVQIAELRTRKISLDARARPPKRIYAVQVRLAGEEGFADDLPRPTPARVRPLAPGQRPIIVGTGPAGLWAALRLLEQGVPSLLLDRGQSLAGRHRAVVGLRRGGVLDPETNLCFGEGGAGTYSDGKLYTRIRDPLVPRVARDLVGFGADPQILVEAHPHVGTNRLIRVLDRFHAHLEASGCELRFGARVDGLLRAAGGRVTGVHLADGTELVGPAVILATGHSARDTYGMLHALGVRMVPKALAIGARVEHPQSLIDRVQYGRYAAHPDLEAAAYAVATQVGSRGAYSFCMCPGGFVIPTPTEVGHLNVNGMSNQGRGGRFANSALVVTVEPSDFWLERPGDLDHLGPLAGIAFQRRLERDAFAAGGGAYAAPAQRLTDFLAGRAGELPARTSYRPRLAAADLRALLPARFADPLARAVHRFEAKLPGFLTETAVLIGVETTTSSPLRVLRDARTLQAPGFPGLFPCGEGAGYSGGIVSSAVDGIRVAEACVAALAPAQSGI
jgi:uncharacterized FAD-dependent dehydrogenase